MTPLVIDAILRLLLIAALLLPNSRQFARKHLWGSKFRVWLLIMDVLSVIPFLVRAIYIRPYDANLSEFPRLILVLLELAGTSRVLRVIKDVPSIWAIRITIAKSTPHLVLPFFFFFAFNITAAVLFYFMEPCFNVDTCPWHDLFEATFFCVVTMSTSTFLLFVHVIVLIMHYLFLLW